MGPSRTEPGCRFASIWSVSEMAKRRYIPPHPRSAHVEPLYRRKQAKRREPMAECGRCGYRGPESDFLKVDPNNDTCPSCYETNDIIHELGGDE